jgi:molybdopterin converting factor subunit 1
VTVTALYFALYREELASRAARIELPEGATIATLWERCVQGHPRLLGLRRVTRFARNNDYVGPETVLCDGDEVAFLPPVSGGSDGLVPGEQTAVPYMVVTAAPLDLEPLIGAVSSGANGAIVTFSGVVRHTADDNRRVVALEYEAYEEMARAKLMDIAYEIAERWPDVQPTGVAIAHRTGHLDVGEASVLIAVASPHRKAAFEACAYAIDRLKEYVPIWKKEVYADGAQTWLGLRS